MPFVSDEQRKAAFARMKGRGTGGRSPRSPRAPRTAGPIDDRIMSIIGEWLLSGGNRGAGQSSGFHFMQNGEGIEGSAGGPVALTGGAIYGTPGSQWYLNESQEETIYYGQAPQGNGIGPANIPIPADFMPAETFLGYVYLAMQGIDPNSGQTQWSGAGTLKSPISLDLARQLNDRYAGPYNFAFHGGVRPTIASDRTNEVRPWWAR